MKIEFRFPGTAEYSYASLWTTEGSPFDNHRELRDVSDDLLLEVGNILKRGCAMTAVAVLNPQVVNEEAPTWPSEPTWNSEEAQNAPQAYQAQQPYQAAPPAYQPPQQAYSAPQAPQAAPPGQQAPVCAHGPAKLVPAGISKSTGNAYGAFWACQAPRGQQKCQLPKI